MDQSAIEQVQRELRGRANPNKAREMSRYIYSSQYRRMHGQSGQMPFYGVQKSARAEVFRCLKQKHAPASQDEYVSLVSDLWALPHREEKYLALAVGGRFKEFIVPSSMALYRRLIVEGAWWDLVDDVAVHMIRELVLRYPDETWPTIDRWNDDEDMWLRRTSIICQVGAKERTDRDRLFGFCEARMHEKEFFIRKAIGWALREYAKTDPEAVANFVLVRREAMAGLSYREATKHIGHLVSV